MKGVRRSRVCNALDEVWLKHAVGRKSRRAQRMPSKKRHPAPDLSRTDRVACSRDVEESNDGSETSLEKWRVLGTAQIRRHLDMHVSRNPGRAEIFALPRTSATHRLVCRTPLTSWLLDSGS